jgi:cytidine deaminase
MTKNSELREMAKNASLKAHSPYSNVKVGSALITDSGKYFEGCNIENSSFGGTICAERVAIFNAISQGESKIRKIYVYTKAGWPPCGLCRQVMCEFAEEDLIVIIGNEKGEEKEILFRDLMPLAYTPSTYHAKE